VKCHFTDGPGCIIASTHIFEFWFRLDLSNKVWHDLRDAGLEDMRTRDSKVANQCIRRLSDRSFRILYEWIEVSVLAHGES
jgi:hypothetical protein